MCRNVENPVNRLASGVPFFKQQLDLFDHPGLLVGIYSDVFVYCDHVCAVLYVALPVNTSKS